MSQQHTVLPAREMVRHYQRLFKQVTQLNQPVIVATKQGEKVALISLQALEEFTRLKEEAQEGRKLTAQQGLPTDLSTRHDTYLWEQTD
jgi:PHD/YefM family antitoxin component YafN of YafNO toxin-antitoxin module